MKYKKIALIFFLIPLYLTLLTISIYSAETGEESGEGDWPETTATSEEQYKIDIQKHPQTATTDDMAKYDDVTKDNGDKFSE